MSRNPHGCSCFCNDCYVDRKPKIKPHEELIITNFVERLKEIEADLNKIAPPSDGFKLVKVETCGFCEKPCNNEWCCVKDKK